MGELERHQHSGTRQEWMGGYIRSKFDSHRYARHGSYHHDFAWQILAIYDDLGASAYEYIICCGRQMVDCGYCRTFKDSDSERKR